uniref:COesterase domain-containing protein n=1 Tax=Anisakis simplex TaxID=6269 RepID=A0A0M3J0W0_ANISI
LQDNFCVIHELIPHTSNGSFKRYWGYVVISDRFARTLHHSAAHFQSDGDVCNEAAALFERTAARSLVIAGASRFAVIGNETNKCQKKTSLADAAHNNETMFQTFNEAIYEVVTNNKSKSNSTFIQWHGMAETSCSKVKVFVSVGANNASNVYRDGNLTANRV